MKTLRAHLFLLLLVLGTVAVRSGQPVHIDGDRGPGSGGASSVTVKSMLGQGFGMVFIVEGKVQRVFGEGRANRPTQTIVITKVKGENIPAPVAIQMEGMSKELTKEIDALPEGSDIHAAVYENLYTDGVPENLQDFARVPATIQWTIKNMLVAVKLNPMQPFWHSHDLHELEHRL